MNLTRVLLPALVLLTLAPAARADAARPGSRKEALEAKVDAYLAPYVTSRDFSGVVLIARGDKILFRKGYGMANYELGVPNTPDTKFRIASLTKSFTVAAIVMLQEKGRLRFEDRLDKFLPGFPRADRITLLHLLTHRSGVAEPDFGAIFSRRVTPDELIATFKDKPPLSEPGKEEHYSNAGFALLARVVEKASGQPYGKFLRDHIFKPLGMDDTGYFDEAEIVPKRASGYAPGPGRLGLERAPAQNASTCWAAAASPRRPTTCSSGPSPYARSASTSGPH
jgi:CubicO group peptidase (beta-lactamase class C family)